MSHSDRSYESTQQPSYHVQAIDPRRPNTPPPPSRDMLAPPQPLPMPSSSPPGPHDPSTPLPESLNTMPQFMAHQLQGGPESHQFDDAEESLSAAAQTTSLPSNSTPGDVAEPDNQDAPGLLRPTWQVAPTSSPDPPIPTSSADPIVASERDEIDDSLVIEDSQIENIDIPSPQDSSSASPPPVRTPRKAAAASSPKISPNRTPLSKLKPPLPASRTLGKARSNIIAVPPQPRLDFAPPSKRAKTITPQKPSHDESEDSFAGGNAHKVAPLRRLNQIFDQSEILPIPPEMVTNSQLDDPSMDEGEVSPRANGLPAPFRAVSPVSPSPPKRTVILPPSSDEQRALIAAANGNDAVAEAPSGSSRSAGFAIPPRRFAVPSQDESEDTSPSKKSHLFSSQSTNQPLFASESQFSYTFQATQFNTIPNSSPPVPSDGSGARESNGTNASKTSGPSVPEEATQIVSDLSQRRTAEYLGPIYPNVHSPAVAHSPVVTSPAVVQIQANRRLGRRPIGLGERPSVSLPNENLPSAVSEGQPSPATVAAPEMPALEKHHRPNGAEETLKAFAPNEQPDIRTSLTPPPTAAAHVSPLPGSSPDAPIQQAPKVIAGNSKSRNKRSLPASSPPPSASEQELTRRPSKRTRRPPSRFTPEPEPEPQPAPEIVAPPLMEHDVNMEASDEGSDEDQPVRRSTNKSRARPRIPESQPEEPNGHQEEVHLRNNDDTSDDELLLKPIKSARGKRRIPITPSPADAKDQSELSDPATPPDPENSDFESFHPTKKALLAKKQQLAGATRGQKRKSDVSTVASAKSKAPATKARRMTRSSIDSSERLTTPSSIQDGATKEIRVLAYWNGTPSGWYLGNVVGGVGEQYRIRFEDKTEANVPLGDIRRCELRKGESVWASGPKALKKKGELIVAEDWGSSAAAYKVGPRVTNKNGQSAGHILPKNVFIHRQNPPQEFEDREVEASDLEITAAPDPSAAGPSTALIANAPSTRGNSPIKGSKKGAGALAGKTFLVTAAADFGHLEVDNMIRAHGGTVRSNWEDLFTIPPNRFGSTLRKSGSAPFVIYVGTPLQMNPKFMVALAAGIPCLSSEYIEAVAKDADVDWRSYLLSSGQSAVMNQWCSQMVDPLWGNEQWSTGDARNPRQPFTDKAFLFLEPRSEHLKDLVPFCVSALGATQFTIAKAVNSQNAMGVDYIIVETRDKNWKSAVGKALQDDERLCCIQWLKECLIMGAALPPALKYDS